MGEDSNPENHIYEAIDSDIFSSDDDDKKEKDDLLLSISFERRMNLKFYGSTNWDFLLPVSFSSFSSTGAPSMRSLPPCMIHFSVATLSQNSLLCEMISTPPL